MASTRGTTKPASKNGRSAAAVAVPKKRSLQARGIDPETYERMHGYYRANGMTAGEYVVALHGLRELLLKKKMHDVLDEAGLGKLRFE